MEWVEDEKERDGEAARANAGHRVGKAECHPRKIHSNENLNATNQQMLELELENLRLTRLVADLLLKNQRLRTSN